MNLSTPVLLAKAATSPIAPGGEEVEDLEGEASKLGAGWGARPLEFFFAPSSGGGEVSYNLNSFVTVEGASGLPPLPLSLVFIDPGPEAADREGAEGLVKTGKGEVLVESPADFPAAILAEEKVQVVEDWRAEESFKNASALEQPAQIPPSALEAMAGLAKQWEGGGSLPKILVSPSSLSSAQLEEGMDLGYGAALEGGGEGETLSLPGGKVTLLASSPLLSSLAEGEASNAWANAEESFAGRQARFTAELAAARGRRAPLIVRVSPASSPILLSLAGSGWIRFTTLKQDLSYPWPAAAASPPAPAARAGTEPSLLQEIRSAAGLSQDPAAAKGWSESVGAKAAYAELCAQSQNEKVKQAGEEAVSLMSRALREAVDISSSKNVTVLSESALLPVTVKNSLPFPIEAKVRSLASNSQITILPEKSAEVGSGMEGQIDFPVQIHSSIKSQVTFWMGEFYHPITKISTQLNSHLTVTRLNVIILIIPAGLLTIFGCIRQMRRKKKNG
ncbi:MAG: hypothetical protein IKS61_03210 [Aeriscardovia sp.]|nr:hypothetical protein [Aeriscardovia sp.]